MMDMAELKASVEGIRLSDEARGRIVQNCRASCTDADRRGRHGWVRRPASAAAAAALCLCLAAAAVAAGALSGVFKDVTRWDGAVVGARYEQATEEITVCAAPVEDALAVTVVMAYPDRAPYREIDSLGIGSYRIEDGSGNVIAEGDATDMAEVSDGRAEITLGLEGIPDGDYRLFIDSFTGGSKADQPLPILGAWECDFTV